MTAPSQQYDGASVIVVGVDSSETAGRAAALALGLARRQHSRLVCVYVNAAVALVALDPGSGEQISLAHREAAATIERHMLDLAGQYGVTMHFSLLSGDPLHEIVRVADEERADLVVVGASASPGHRVVGSIATRLVRLGHWPVTVVP